MMQMDMLDIIRNYTFGKASVFLLLCGKNGRILDTNTYTKDFLGFDPVYSRIKDVFIDFHNQFDLRKLIKAGNVEQMINIKTFTGLPQTIYINLFDLESNILILGRRDVKEQENLRKDIIDLNNDLNSLTRQLHKQNSELEKLNKLKNQFLGMAAHDLRTPAGVILNFSKFIQEDLESELDEEHKDFLKRIIRSASFMQQIINDFLDVALIEAGSFHLNIEEVDIAELIKSNFHQQKILARKENIELKLIMDFESRIALIDTSKIEQVLNNLISNAIDHSDTGKTVIVECIQHDNSLEVRIIDQGPGVSENKQKEIFDIYKHNRKELREKKDPGLGLAISKKIISSHNGKIWVESRLGKGSKFCFSIPI